MLCFCFVRVVCVIRGQITYVSSVFICGLKLFYLRVLACICGQITYITSAFICVHLWTYSYRPLGDIGESISDTLSDQVMTSTIKDVAGSLQGY